MRSTALILAALAVVMTTKGWAASAMGGGRGGPFIEYHGSSLSKFDPALGGNPIVIGGAGYGIVSKQFRIGGGGGGGFLWAADEKVNFGMGYGGAIAEYQLSPWLAARLMIGGGGYSVAKVLSETDTSRTVEKISSGGFLLFYPSLSGEVAIDKWINLAFNLGYFIPNVPKLTGFTMGLHLIFGKI